MIIWDWTFPWVYCVWSVTLVDCFERFLINPLSASVALIYAIQLTGFYMRATLVLNRLTDMLSITVPKTNPPASWITLITKNKFLTKNQCFKFVTGVRCVTNAGESFNKVAHESKNCFLLVKELTYFMKILSHMTTTVTLRSFYRNFISRDENKFLVITIQSRTRHNWLKTLTYIISRSTLYTRLPLDS